MIFLPLIFKEWSVEILEIIDCTVRLWQKWRYEENMLRILLVDIGGISGGILGKWRFYQT